MSFLEWIILEGVGKILKVNNFNNSWGLERSFRKLYYFFPRCKLSREIET